MVGVICRLINKNLQDQAQAIFNEWFISSEPIPKVPIAEIALNITDGVHNTVSDDPAGDHLLLSCKNIKGGILTIGNTERRISKDTFDKLRKRTKLSKGDVLLSSVGTVGELYLLNEDPTNYEFQRSVAMIKPDPSKISSIYLYEALLSQQQLLINTAHGAVQQCIFISDIGKFEIPLAEYSRIMEYTSLVMPMMDTISANHSENIHLEFLRDSLLPQLINGVIDVADITL